MRFQENRSGGDDDITAGYSFLRGAYGIGLQAKTPVDFLGIKAGSLGIHIVGFDLLEGEKYVEGFQVGASLHSAAQDADHG